MIFLSSPLEQFEIIPLFSLYFFPITNQNIFLILLFVITFISFRLSYLKWNLIPNIYQSLNEILFSFVQDLVKTNINSANLFYFPLIFCSFLFILGCNLLGMIPYSFTITSHIFMTFSLSLALFIGINIIGFKKHGFHFFEFFLPNGISIIAAPLFVVIELLSYLSRVFSLSIRLFANLLSGHALLKILIGFSWTMLCSNIFLLNLTALLPFVIVIAVTLLELAIAFLQAYVFSVLISLYLKDVIELAH